MWRPFRFTPPDLAGRAVARQRLLSMLGRRWDARLVTVEANAGFGKTTLLAQALAENLLDPRGTDVWLTAEPADASASNLLAGILTALGRTEAGQLPTVEAVCEAIWNAAPLHVCVCVDDAHVIGATSAGRHALGELVDGLPDNGHLLVATRPGGSPAAARLAALGLAVEVTEKDLRFDDDELTALAAAHGVDVAELAGTDGWPALAALWATAGHGHARRFVSEEVLRHLDERDRAGFVLAVAAGGGDAEVVAAAAGVPVDIDALRALPLVASDADAIRPHALWDELLASELAAADVRGARRRAAAVLRGRGDAAPAFELLAAAQDWDEALAALFDACNDQRQPPWRDAMERWRSLVPDDVAARPEVVYLDALVERELDPWSERCADAFDRAMAGFEAKGDLRREAVTSARAGYSYWVRGDEAALQRIQARRGPIEAAGIPVAASSALNAGVRADIRGDVDELLALADFAPSEEPRLRHFPPLLRVFARFATGDVDAAVADAAAAAQLAEPVWPAAGTGWAAVMPALVAWSRGEIDDSRFAAVDDPGPRLGVGERSVALTLSTVVRALRGDAVGAEQDLTRLRGLCPPGPRSGMVAGLIAVATATVAAQRGDEAAASRAFADELGDAPLDPIGAGRVAVWFPGITWLYHPPARELLERAAPPTLRAAVVEACHALAASHRGEPVSKIALLDRPGVLVSAFPAFAATELALRAVAADDERGVHVIRRLVDRAPTVARAALRHFAADGRHDITRAATSVLGTIAIPPERPLRIEVLGPMRLLRDRQSVRGADWRRERVRQLLVALVVHREIRRERLGVLVWPDLDDETLSSNLRTTLTYLQRLLEPDRVRGDAPWYVRQDAGSLVLSGGDSLEVDLWEFEEALRAARDAAARAAPSLELEQLRRATALWRGEPFADLTYLDWATTHREATTADFVDAATRASELLTNAREPAEAARIASLAIEASPYSERAYRALAAAQTANGQPAAAARTLEECARMLGELRR